MRDDLLGIGIALAIMAALVAGAYAFTAAVGPGPTQESGGGYR